MNLLSGCHRFYSLVSIYFGEGAQNNDCSRVSYMENILVGCWRVEINLSSVPESCFTHVGDRTDLMDISWKSTGTIRARKCTKAKLMVEAGRGVQTVISSMDAGYSCQLLIVQVHSQPLFRGDRSEPNTAQLF